MAIDPQLWEGVKILDRTGERGQVIGHVANVRRYADGEVVGDMVLEDGRTVGAARLYCGTCLAGDAKMSDELRGQIEEAKAAKYPGCRILSLGDACECKICSLEREVSRLRRECNELEAAATRERLQAGALREVLDVHRERARKANALAAEAWRQRDDAREDRDLMAEVAVDINVEVNGDGDLRARLQEAMDEIEGARQEAFSHGFVVDCDPEDLEAVQVADDLRTLVGWIASAEGAARVERDGALARENPYRTADGKPVVLGETELWERDPGGGKPIRHGVCYSLTHGIRLGPTLYAFAGGSMARPLDQCYSSEQAVLNAETHGHE